MEWKKNWKFDMKADQKAIFLFEKGNICAQD